MNSLLSQLGTHSAIVADTGDFESIKKYQPRDATTNPSLLLKAAGMPEYSEIFEKVVADVRQESFSPEQSIASALDKLALAFGVEILKIVSHRVSTEVDARLSFDREATIEKARSLIAAYEKHGIDRERVLIKIASTWEGISAAAELRKDSIRCNMTLLFSQAQAIACATAGVQLISPFVGRILDWHKKASGKESYTAAEDPGVQSVTSIYNYFRKFGYETEVMGASFRNIGEILELAGCDLLTISPGLLEELQSTTGDVPRKLDPDTAKVMNITRTPLDENTFRWEMNQDPMATEKLAEGIRVFGKDTEALENLVSQRLQKSN